MVCEHKQYCRQRRFLEGKKGSKKELRKYEDKRIDRTKHYEKIEMTYICLAIKCFFLLVV
jgi:hypothetical protein